MADAEREAAIRAEALLSAANALGELHDNNEWSLPERRKLNGVFEVVVAARRKDRAAV